VFNEKQASNYQSADACCEAESELASRDLMAAVTVAKNATCVGVSAASSIKRHDTRNNARQALIGESARMVAPKKKPLSLQTDLSTITGVAG